jgi:hypothetical protein
LFLTFDRLYALAEGAKMKLANMDPKGTGKTAVAVKCKDGPKCKVMIGIADYAKIVADLVMLPEQVAAEKKLSEYEAHESGALINLHAVLEEVYDNVAEETNADGRGAPTPDDFAGRCVIYLVGGSSQQQVIKSQFNEFIDKQKYRGIPVSPLSIVRHCVYL